MQRIKNTFFFVFLRKRRVRASCKIFIRDSRFRKLLFPELARNFISPNEEKKKTKPLFAAAKSLETLLLTGEGGGGGGQRRQGHTDVHECAGIKKRKIWDTHTGTSLIFFARKDKNKKKIRM